MHPVLLSDFDFELPRELIARHPAPRRRDSRLLRLDGASGGITHARFSGLPAQLRPGDLLVLNNTRVIPARLAGRKKTGGRVQILVTRIENTQRALALLKASRPPAEAEPLFVGPDGAVELRVGRRQGEQWVLHFPDGDGVDAVLARFGTVPLPPYLQREAEESDRSRYQTVYASVPGAVAAPTAGLHFDEQMLDTLRAQGVQIGFLSLHAGPGTFAPVRESELRRGRLHREWCEVPEALCRQLRQTRRRGGRVIAVGTTVVRALEHAARDGVPAPFRGETGLFILPGYRFRAVDVLLSNFHLPQSSLLLLVCAFAGREHVLCAYREAIERCYRFYSYGDAMLMSPHPDAQRA